MADCLDHLPELRGAEPCKFCGGDFLFFAHGCVSCDRCQAEGPFIDVHEDMTEADARIEAVRLWNLTPDSAEWSE